MLLTIITKLSYQLTFLYVCTLCSFSYRYWYFRGNFQTGLFSPTLVRITLWNSLLSCSSIVMRLWWKNLQVFLQLFKSRDRKFWNRVFMARVLTIRFHIGGLLYDVGLNHLLSYWWACLPRIGRGDVKRGIGRYNQASGTSHICPCLLHHRVFPVTCTWHAVIVCS